MTFPIGLFAREGEITSNLAVSSQDVYIDSRRKAEMGFRTSYNLRS